MRNMETPMESEKIGKPTVRKAEFSSGNRKSREANAITPKGNGNT